MLQITGQRPASADSGRDGRDQELGKLLLHQLSYARILVANFTSGPSRVRDHILLEELHERSSRGVEVGPADDGDRLVRAELATERAGPRVYRGRGGPPPGPPHDDPGVGRASGWGRAQ